MTYELDARLEPLVRAEIESLHEVFTHWLGGTAEPGLFARIESALSAGFTFVSTGGELVDRATLLTGLQRGEGSRPGLEIWIRDVRVRALDGGSPGSTLAVSTYEEWQREGDAERGRLSTALHSVEVDPSSSKPRVLWHHVHETWLETSDEKTP